MPKDGEDAMPWWDVLTSSPDGARPAAAAVLSTEQDGGSGGRQPGSSELAEAAGQTASAVRSINPSAAALLPFITGQEAIGDLPPIMTPHTDCSSSSHQSWSSENVRQQQQQHHHHHQQQQQQYSQQEGTLPEPTDPPGAFSLAARLEQIYQDSMRYLQQLESTGPRGPLAFTTPYLGRDSIPYQPEQGVLLCQLPDPLSHCQPVSRYARYMRTPHWEGQDLGGFKFNCLLHHTCDKPPKKQPLKQLQQQQLSSSRKCIDPCGVSGTVMGKNDDSRSCVHFCEERLLTTLERRRLMSIPDFMVIRGRPKEVEQQVSEGEIESELCG
jgi:site-specific DNA-cytosine methylase